MAAVAVMLAGGLALQALSGGIRVRSLSPVVLAACLAVLGCVLVVHRPRLRLGAVLVVNGVGFAIGVLAAGGLDYGAAHPIPRLAAQAAFATVSFTRVLVVAWVLFILWFPGDRFLTGGWRRYFVATSAICVITAVAVWLAGPPDRTFDFFRATAVPAGAGGPFAGTWPALGRLSDLLLLAPLVAVGSLVQRYRDGDSVIRQQLRWLLLAVTAEVFAQIAGAALMGAGGPADTAGSVISAASQPLPMVAATVAILRFRLWDIELVVSRALVYGTLWALVSVLLLLPAMAAGLIVGGSDAVAALAIALVVTVVFQPVRRHLERLIQRLVYRHRARPYELLRELATTLRTADLDAFGPLVAHGVKEGLGVRWAGVWALSGPTRVLFPLGVAGTKEGPPLDLPGDVAGRLAESAGRVVGGGGAGVWPDGTLVPLVASNELIGVLVCGPRPGDPLRAADFQLLEVLGRQCALRLRNLRLESQLRERLALIETQAEELRRSRQRLVAAEDTARRRIERNLHDGVQQQLVSLAVRLRRAATDGAPRLLDLAGEAEEAVFALQELGRGIYPSVLADQGLPAALRTQAARMPIPVHIEVDESLIGRRLGREVEAALYYVALEALTNVQKHVPEASAVVWLRSGGEQVTLEVIDNGPGCDGNAGSGSGLQNMADRISAIGGSFEIRRLAEGGTRVCSTVSLDAPGSEQQDHPAEADSRR